MSDDVWSPPEPSTIWRFTVDGAEEMLGRKLRDGERERIEKAIDNSSIPQALEEVMFQFADDAKVCKHCGAEVYIFDKAPEFAADENGQGWATDDSGDVMGDFICPERESTGRFPDGKPHEVND